MSVRWIVFDAVGTLIEPQPDVATAYHLIGQQHGSRLSRDDVSARFRAAFAADEAADRSDGQLTTSEDIEVDRWRRIVAEVLDDVAEPGPCFQDLFDHFGRSGSWRCFDDVAFTLRQLADRGCRLAIASNFDRRLHPICDQLTPLAPLEVRVVSSEVGWRKPAVEFYQQVIAAVSAQPDEILVVGDDVINDVDAARAAGLEAIHLDRSRAVGESVVVDSSLPIASLTELLERIP